MSRLFVVTSTHRELVLAESEDDAYAVFNAHSENFEHVDSEAEEITRLVQLSPLDMDKDTGVWGATEMSAGEFFELARTTRVPVHVVVEDDVGKSLREIVPGFKKDIGIGANVVGHVVYRLPDGKFVLESGEQWALRKESDADVRRQIEMNKLADLQTRMVRQMEVVNGL